MKNFLLILILILTSCSQIEKDTKKIIHASGKKVGSTITEFSKGVAEGIQEGLAYNVNLSQELKETGISSGEVKVLSDSIGTDNKLSVYFSFENNFSDEIFAVIHNPQSKEIGRSSTIVSAQRGDAFYVDFVFPIETNIDLNSEITLK